MRRGEQALLINESHFLGALFFDSRIKSDLTNHTIRMQVVRTSPVGHVVLDCALATSVGPTDVWPPAACSSLRSPEVSSLAGFTAITHQVESPISKATHVSGLKANKRLILGHIGPVT
jgi:hypothetical protein